MAERGATVREVLLALNVGSSSLKFAIAAEGAPDTLLLSGTAERIGSGAAFLKVAVPGRAARKTELPGADHARAVRAVAEAAEVALGGARVVAVGHRIVHGGVDFTEPVRLDADAMRALEALIPLAPLHQPMGLQGVRVAQALFPRAVQIGCFDTAFHADQPWVQAAFALPRAFYDAGIRRYGFHGLSCQSIRRTLLAEGYPVEARRIVIAHLGNGCSVTAMQGGVGVASSMGFSTLDGLTMGTRTGRIDPGVLIHLLREGYAMPDLEDLLYRKSGLLGLSGLSNDMRDLLASEAPAAADAVAHFVARAVEEICRLAGVMVGLDAVVFCGGIGENAGVIRDRIADGIAFLGAPEVLVRETREEHEILLAAQEMTER